MAVQITTPFAIPVGLARLGTGAALNQQLRSLFLEREAAGTLYSNAKATMLLQTGVFESRFDLFKWPEPAVRQLREFCWTSLFGFVGELNGQTLQQMSQIQGHADAWFHVTRAGGHFGLHNHPMASWSGVYCVDPGDNSQGRSGGLLSFPHPNGAAGMYVDASTNKLKLPYNLSTREYHLTAGQLILFPSWLPHQVTPYHGEGERITVAFNAWFTSAGDINS